MIPFNKPFAPPVGEFESYIKGIWERGWFTNHGPLVQELEERLKEYLDLSHFLYVGNGTVALQLAIRALDLRGEIITTPFSYVATTSSIVWQGCRPVFADIDPGTLNINPGEIEALITPDTSAIIATHVFGNPCDIEAIDTIAKKHNLKVIYDAAHCFGTLYKGRSVLNRGDISTISFHATKVFQTVEGGAVITGDADSSTKIDLMRNFGHDGPERFTGVGINGKNSEVHAAMGLSMLPYIDNLLRVRKQQYNRYRDLLIESGARYQLIQPGSETNGAYFPLVFDNRDTLLHVKMALEDAGIYTRRYFYPSLSKLDYVGKSNTPVSDAVAESVLCLPLYHGLTEADQNRIAGILIEQKQHA